MLTIPTFNELVIREAILNAVSHRDYRHAGSVFIKQYPTKIELAVRYNSGKHSLEAASSQPAHRRGICQMRNG
ncbi:MAG: hypothetical protein JRD93_21685 [Deltaproteobacteria bacterium]|nr:hypothetical protein [Deltaproteobacteria bacterium]